MGEVLLCRLHIQAELLGDAPQNLGSGTGADEITSVEIPRRWQVGSLPIRVRTLGPNRDLEPTGIEGRLRRDLIDHVGVLERQPKIRLARLS